MKDDISPSPLVLSIKFQSSNKRKGKRLLSFNCTNFTFKEPKEDIDLDDYDGYGKGEDDYKIKIKSKIKLLKDNTMMGKIRENIMENAEKLEAFRRVSKDVLLDHGKLKDEDIYEDDEIKAMGYNMNEYGYTDELCFEISDDEGQKNEDTQNDKKNEEDSEDDSEDKDLAILEVLKKANKDKSKMK